MSLTNNDLARAFYLSALGLTESSNTVTDVTGITVEPRGDDSLSTYASVTAPALGATIASLTTPPSGLYEVRVSVRITTGANASLADNLEVLQTAAVKRRVLHNIVSTTSTLLIPEYTQCFRVDGTQNILVRAVAAEAASVIYAVSMTARKVAD